MKNRVSLLSRVSAVAVLAIALGVVPDARSQSPRGSSQIANVVHGDVLNIEGDTYTIKDVSGHEIQLRVDNQTQREDRIKVGDKIEAHVSSDGHAENIRVAIP